jgi:hypothetical protein
MAGSRVARPSFNGLYVTDWITMPTSITANDSRRWTVGVHDCQLAPRQYANLGGGGPCIGWHGVWSQNDQDRRPESALRAPLRITQLAKLDREALRCAEGQGKAFMQLCHFGRAKWQMWFSHAKLRVAGHSKNKDLRHRCEMMGSARRMVSRRPLVADAPG